MSGDHPNYYIFLDRSEYWEESWRFDETCYHSNFSERPSANADVKISQGVIIIIINECSKLAQKEYKTRHDWVDKVILWELCKKFKFDHANKWYMHNLESVLENETNKLLWDFEIQTDHQISARRPDLEIISKRKRSCQIVECAVPADHRVKLKENGKKNKHLDLARELKKLGNIKVTFIPVVIGALDTVTKGLIQGREDFEIRGRVETI